LFFNFVIKTAGADWIQILWIFWSHKLWIVYYSIIFCLVFIYLFNINPKPLTPKSVNMMLKLVPQKWLIITFLHQNKYILLYIISAKFGNILKNFFWISSIAYLKNSLSYLITWRKISQVVNTFLNKLMLNYNIIFHKS